MAKPTIKICAILTSFNNQSQRLGMFACKLVNACAQGAFYMNSTLFYSSQSGSDTSFPPAPGPGDNPLVVDLADRAIGLAPGGDNVFRCYDTIAGDYAESGNIAVRGVLLYLDALPTQDSTVTGDNLVFKFDYYIDAGQKIKLTASFGDGSSISSDLLDGGIAGSSTLSIPMVAGQSRNLLSFSVTNESASPSPPSVDLFFITQSSDNVRKVQPGNTWKLPKPVTFSRPGKTALPAGLVAFLSSDSAPSGFTSLGVGASLFATRASFKKIASPDPGTVGVIGVGSASVCVGGYLYVSGGLVGGDPQPTFMRRDLSTGAWEKLPDMTAKEGSRLDLQPRAHHRMLVVGGKLLCAYGLTLKDGKPAMARYSLVYDPATESWSRSSNAYKYPRYDAAIAEFKGVVYCFGGLDLSSGANRMQAQCSSINLGSADDAIEVNLTIPSDGFKRRYGAVALTGPDAVYIVGGSDVAPSSVLEPKGEERGRRIPGLERVSEDHGCGIDAYSPTTERYQRVGALARMRIDHAACLMGDTVYLIGGKGSDGSFLPGSSTEAFSISRLPGESTVSVPVDDMNSFICGQAAVSECAAYLTGGKGPAGLSTDPGSIPLGMTLIAMRKD